MAIQTVSAASGATALTNAVRARYIADYINAAQLERLYDQLATPIAADMSRVAEGSSIVLNFISDMNPGTTSIPETVDITPQTLSDATTSITHASRGEALQASEQLMLQEYTDYGKRRFEAVGKNMMESVDLLAQGIATKGALVERAAARAALDAGTSTHRATDSLFSKMSTKLTTLKCPGFPAMGGTNWVAIMHPAAYHDIREGGNVLSVAQYQDKEIILNNELGKIGQFKLVASAWAKVFGSAGIDNDDAIATTLVSSVSPLSKTITLAVTTHLDSSMSQYWTIGTEETAGTHYPTNERFEAVSYTTSVVTLVGEAANGGLRFHHASGTAVRNADSVYPIVFGGPESLVKVYQPEIGEYGKIVGPKVSGTLEQFVSLGWKYHGNYGLVSENRLVRAEVSASCDIQ